MAVTKISRTSRWILYALSAITIILIGLFFFGGNVPMESQIPEIAGKTEPVFTNGLLLWVYILLGLTVLAVFVFSIVGFIGNLKHNRKKAFNSLLGLLVLAALLVITYIIGDGTPLNILGYEGPDNVPSMLKLTDMWIYSISILMGLTILAMLFSPLIKRVGKRK